MEKTIDDIAFDPLDRFVTTEKLAKTKRAWSQEKHGWVDVNISVVDAFVDWVYQIDRRLIGHNVEK